MTYFVLSGTLILNQSNQCVQVSVPELTTAGVSVLTVSAVDSDSGNNGRVTYSMLPLDSFNISATTGDVTDTVTGPRLGDSLPANLHQTTSCGQSRRHLKSYLFRA